VSLPPPVVAWLRAEGFGETIRLQSSSGGCIHTAVRIETRSGRSFFLKTNPGVPPDMFLREAEGLQTLRGAGPRVPTPLLHGATFILMEDLTGAAPAPEYWETLGRSLARLHAHEGETFGFDHDNYLGLTPQPNPRTPDGHVFFSDHRIRFQARRAAAAGRLETQDLARVDALLRHLNELIPVQPPSLIHGDLWSGNVIPGPDGDACLIDPACHYGWAEAELGMTSLFGGFPDAFYRAYEEARPLAPGWRERLPVYNLYHLLNHLNLFGSGYLNSVRAVLRTFG
jgi:protein-ribulosamine 3-kinase